MAEPIEVPFGLWTKGWAEGTTCYVGARFPHGKGQELLADRRTQRHLQDGSSNMCQYCSNLLWGCYFVNHVRLSYAVSTSVCCVVPCISLVFVSPSIPFLSSPPESPFPFLYDLPCFVFSSPFFPIFSFPSPPSLPFCSTSVHRLLPGGIAVVQVCLWTVLC